MEEGEKLWAAPSRGLTVGWARPTGLVKKQTKHRRNWGRWILSTSNSIDKEGTVSKAVFKFENRNACGFPPRPRGQVLLQEKKETRKAKIRIGEQKYLFIFYSPKVQNISARHGTAKKRK